MNGSANAERWPCPTCGAAVGEHCVHAHGSYYVWAHPARLLVQDKNLGCKLLKLLDEKARPGWRPSSHCRASRHTACHGLTARNHGLPGLPCTCSCYKEKRNETS